MKTLLSPRQLSRHFLLPESAAVTIEERGYTAADVSEGSETANALVPDWLLRLRRVQIAGARRSLNEIRFRDHRCHAPPFLPFPPAARSRIDVLSQLNSDLEARNKSQALELDYYKDRCSQIIAKLQEPQAILDDMPVDPPDMDVVDFVKTPVGKAMRRIGDAMELLDELDVD